MFDLKARIISVQFDEGYSGNSRGYAYHSNDETIEVGDLVVVVSPHGPGFMLGWTTVEGGAPINGTPKIVKVVSVTETPEAIEKVREWVVCKLDFTAWIERKVAEEKRQVLVAKIKRAKSEAIAKLELADLAAGSPELATLLKQLDDLN